METTNPFTAGTNGSHPAPPTIAEAMATQSRAVPGQNMNFLLDVRLAVSVEVGRVNLPVRQVMELQAGSVVELQRSASEPVEIFANGRCIGRGEIVVVGDHFGVRVTELGPMA